ncbi:MAG: undecaprenyl-phosphate glucose phosphotransferase [Candidatus Dadabacteria bacterium]|nr:MAG: undecaprenyl-phosphate glucose phosphotransferase [Candidatus Dadabacteria bacterium]
MLKEKRRLFEFILMGFDVATATISWLLAYWIRFYSGWIVVDKGIPDIKPYLSLIFFIWLIWPFAFKWMGLYRPMRGVRRIKELLLLFNANTFALLLFIAATYLFREKIVPYSRLVFILFWALSVVLTSLERVVLRKILMEMRRRGYNLRYMLIVGSGNLAGDIASRVRLHRELGIQLVGCLSKTGKESKGTKGIPVLGKYEELGKILQEKPIDQVIIALPMEENHYFPLIMEQIGDSLVDVRVVPDLHRYVSLRGAIEEFEGLPVICLRESPIEGANRIIKRAVDLGVASLGLIIFSPVMLIIAVIIKLTSRGPVFYSQERVSVDGTSFKILKFRTMYTDAERDGPGWTKPNDKRVTPVGAWLRKWSLDELPQLINVLRGEMSIVGPRPERPVFIEEFRKRVPRYMLRHKVPAGMTGWAQVNGWRGDTSIDKRIEYDLYYIENWSLLLDLKIMFLTLFKGLRNRNAY